MHRPKHPFWVVTGLNKSLQHIGFIVLDGIGTGLAKTKNNLKGMQGLGYGLCNVEGTYHITTTSDIITVYQQHLVAIWLVSSTKYIV